MNQCILTKRSVIALFLILLLSALWIGCSSKVSQRKDEPGTSESQGTTAPPSKYFAKYYSFEDVLVPGELNYDSDRTLIYETPQFKAVAEKLNLAPAYYNSQDYERFLKEAWKRLGKSMKEAGMIKEPATQPY